jgi:ectoine hydroxylase-related dioxygenase (phytanoyl-CoA dioxygenase family)
MAGPALLSGAELGTGRGLEAARTALAEEGYVLVENVLEQPELDQLRAETDAHLARVLDGTAEPLVREEDGVPFRVENIAGYPIGSRCVLAARTHPVLLDAMTSLIGPDVISYGSVLVFKLAQVGPAVAMHSDIAEGVFSPGHLWYAAGVYLDDAARENGCLWVVPGSHLLSGAELAAVSAQGLDADGAVPLPARAGSVLLHDSRVLHGSRASAGGGLRRVLYHSYQGAQWMLAEGLKRSFRPGQKWIAESFRLMDWGVEVRAELGYGAKGAWQIPREWRAPAAAVEPRDDLALIRYRTTDTR